MLPLPQPYEYLKLLARTESSRIHQLELFTPPANYLHVIAASTPAQVTKSVLCAHAEDYLQHAESKCQCDVIDKKLVVCKETTRADLVEAELQILQQVQHPHIVKVLNNYRVGNRYYLLFEYVAGQNLCHAVNLGRMNLSQIEKIMAQMLSVLAYLAAREILHRDIKLENIMLLPDGSIKVIDWGFAVSLRITSKDVLRPAGSMHYAAPEILENVPIFAPCNDVWSLGVVFYALIENRLPFPGNSAHDVFKAVRSFDYCMQDVCPFYQRILRQMLCSSQERFSAEQLAPYFPFTENSRYYTCQNCARERQGQQGHRYG